MADDKKPDAKPAPVAKDPFVDVVWMILTILVILYLINEFLNIIDSKNFFFNPEGSSFPKIKDWWSNFFSYFKYISVVISGLLMWVVFYLGSKIKALFEEEQKRLYPEVAVSTKDINPKWERVLTHLDSLNENDWRLAILEADIMLSDLLDQLSLPGDTMGDKLKAVERSDFTTIDNAWEAHKVRNRIAHDGADFLLNQHEAKRVIGLYQTVFEQFGII